MANDLIAIDAELTRLTKALRVAVGEFEKAIRDAADKRSAYDVAWAQALLSLRNTDGTQKIKEAEATLAVQNQMTEARIAEAMRDAYKERIRAIESVISVQQSRIKFMTETEPSGF